MRIIAGEYKGRPLAPVPGSGTRPTTSRVKEAWASSLISMIGVEGDGLGSIRVLDAFAGSGALGLELLSRGAKSCVFCEQDAKALRTIKHNIAALHLDPRRAYVCNVDTLSPQLLKYLDAKEPFGIVIIDAPYSYKLELIKGLLSTLARSGLIRNETLVSYEHSVDASSNLDNFILCRACSPMALHLMSQKTYGTIGIDYYRCQ